jgi:YebC/PmpR family DNA-binding regulatory protein
MRVVWHGIILESLVISANHDRSSNMSGHSHWATIRRKKGAADAKRGQIYTRLAREIVLAAREGGGDADSNPALALAIDRARAQNMPKDNIERAIKRGTGESRDGAALEQIFYEGYGPHGIALMVEVVTDNRNRAVAEVRHQLTRGGGNMAEAGSVSWQFNRVASFSFEIAENNPDKIFELAVEAGADDVIFEKDTVEIVGPVESFKSISEALKRARISPDEAGLRMAATNEIELEDDQVLQILKLVEALEELDDVQNVYHNLKVPDSIWAQLEEA